MCGINANTDGVLFYVRKIYDDKLTELVHEWENVVGFTMEDDNMQMFFQRDVNNYIEVTSNPKKPYKLKGKWSNQAEETLANLNAPITHEAILNYYTKGISIEETINSCDNIIKFCFTAKTGRSYDKTYYYYNNEPRLTNKINRVVATTNEKCGTIKKYKSEEDRYDKIAEIPEHCALMNDDLVMIDSLDRQWYIDFAKNKLEELTCVNGSW